MNTSITNFEGSLAADDAAETINDNIMQNTCIDASDWLIMPDEPSAASASVLTYLPTMIVSTVL